MRLMSRRERREREQALYAEPEWLNQLCSFIADRGTLDRWCKQHDVRYLATHEWLHADADRLKHYTAALEVRNAALTDRVISGLSAIADSDHRQAFDKRGHMLKPHKLPDSIAAAVSGIDVTKNERGEQVTKLRLNDRSRGHELLGRHLGMFKDKLDVTIDSSFAARLEAARARVKQRKKA
jgi:terminase small subunit-like protein